MRAGPMRHRPTLYKPARVKNRTGGFDETWIESGQLWAEFTLPTGRIEAVAEKLSAVVTAEVRVRPRQDLVAGCRLVNRGVTYLIVAALPDNELSMLRLLCTNVPNP